MSTLLPYTTLFRSLVDGLSFNSVATSSDVDNLNIISSGPVPPNPSELLASKQFEKFLDDAAHMYEMIIIDSPPLLAVTDSQVLATKVDGVIVIARSTQTETTQLEESVDLIGKVNGNIIGTVLNDVQKEDNSNYYYYYV